MNLPIILHAFGDNYIYLMEYAPQKAFVIDPGQASVVIDAVSQRGLTLTHILATHHHADHIGGIGSLVDYFGSEVISSDKKRIRPTGTLVSEGETFQLGTYAIGVIATPGHTNTGVCFYVTDPDVSEGLLFSGDTLFVCGCGRLFECDAETMFRSFAKLSGLPDGTRVYPGHNYTQENLRFALTVEPDHFASREKLDEVVFLDRQGMPTVPSTIGQEKLLNPFVRAQTPKEFGRLRALKDNF